MKLSLLVVFLLLSTCNSNNSKEYSFSVSDCGNSLESPYLADDLMFTPKDQLNIAIRFIQFKKIPIESTIEYSLLKESIDSLNLNFKNSNIKFTMLNDSLSLDSNVLIMGKDLHMSDYKSHILEYKRLHSNDLPAIDIFVYPVEFGFYPAIALAIKSDGVAIQKIFISSNTLTHEIGHCLGLYHTHQNASIGNINNENGYYSGDLICDTPATGDISGLIDANCTKASTKEPITDKNMEIIIHNYMSYVNKACRKEFTKDQIDRMRFNISKEPMLRNVLIF